MKPIKMLPYFASELLTESSLPREYALYHVTNQGLISNVLGKISPSVITIHDVIPFIETRNLADLIIKRIMAKKIPQANAFICISEATKRDFLKYLRVDPKLVTTIPHGVDHKLFQPREKIAARKTLGLPINRTIILHVGSEEPRKNIPILIEAFSKLVKNFPEALLIRVGKKTAKMHKFIKTCGVDRSVVYFQSISETNLALLYNASDLFVFPSYHEGFGMPVLEAMSSGAPVISTNISAVSEIVGNSGILVNPFDADALAYQMNQVLTDLNLRRELIRKAIARSSEFDWLITARKTWQVYMDLLNLCHNYYERTKE